MCFIYHPWPYSFQVDLLITTINWRKCPYFLISMWETGVGGLDGRLMLISMRLNCSGIVNTLKIYLVKLILGISCKLQILNLYEAALGEQYGLLEK